MNKQDNAISNPDSEKGRYTRLGLISWWSQARVRAATVMVVGAGALGNEVIKNLALVGIGRLFIVDFDTVELSNLSRSVLFREADSGLRKADAAARAVKSLNPDVAVQAFYGNISHDLGLGVFRRMDAIVGCVDNRAARLSINRCCWLLGKPWVDGGIEALLGYVQVFWPGRGACYECTLADEDYELANLRRSCGLLARENVLLSRVPTTPTAAAIIGGIQTQEVLKLIHGMEVQTGVSFIFNGLNNDSYVTRLPIKEDCLSHDSFDEILELPEARADTTTPADLLTIAKEWLGAEVQLFLGHDLVTALYCRVCEKEEPILKPLNHVTESEARCAVCGELRTSHVVTRLTGEEGLLVEQPLSSLGIPPLSILAVYADDKVLGLELTGDADTFLSFR